MRTPETRGYDHDDGARTTRRKEQDQSQNKRPRNVMCAAGSGMFLHADISPTPILAYSKLCGVGKCLKGNKGQSSSA